MKKLLFILPLFALTLAGCNNNCECDCSNVAEENEPIVNENEGLEKATQNCVDLWWTHSLIHSQTAAYGECSFPSGVTCDDQLLLEWQCDYEADTSNIDTPQKRLAGCQENIDNWIKDVEDWELMNISWSAEDEGGASFVRTFEVEYLKDWISKKTSAECVADFVDGSISVTFNDADTDEIDVDEIIEESDQDW